MKMEKEMMYVAPAVEVLEVEVELGFVESDGEQNEPGPVVP